MPYPPCPSNSITDPMTTAEANGVTLGIEHFGEAAAPLVLLAGGTTMLSWPDALCEALAGGGRHVVRYDLRDSGASTTVDPEAPAYTLRDLAADAAALARRLDDRPAHLAGIGVGGMVAQAGSTTRTRSRRSPSPGRDLSLRAWSTTTCPTMTRRRWIGCSRVRSPTGPTALRWPSSPPPARRSSATTPPLHARLPSASGIAHRARSPQSRWPIKWAWCSPSSTASRAGASVCPSSQSRRSWCTVAATHSSRSATARRSRARFPVRGCLCSNKPRLPFPMRPPARSPRRCLTASPAGSVHGRVGGHSRQQGVLAALPGKHVGPEIAVAEWVVGMGVLDDPSFLLELAIELAGAPARVAGEDAY